MPWLRQRCQLASVEPWAAQIAESSGLPARSLPECAPRLRTPAIPWAITPLPTLNRLDCLDFGVHSKLGGAEGIVTIEDVVEDTQDEYDRHEKPAEWLEKLGHPDYRVSARADPAMLIEKLG